MSLFKTIDPLIFTDFRPHRHPATLITHNLDLHQVPAG